jgi:hypothetical protein
MIYARVSLGEIIIFYGICRVGRLAAAPLFVRDPTATRIFYQTVLNATIAPVIVLFSIPFALSTLNKDKSLVSLL